MECGVSGNLVCSVSKFKTDHFIWIHSVWDFWLVMLIYYHFSTVLLELIGRLQHLQVFASICFWVLSWSHCSEPTWLTYDGFLCRNIFMGNYLDDTGIQIQFKFLFLMTFDLVPFFMSHTSHHHIPCHITCHFTSWWHWSRLYPRWQPKYNTSLMDAHKVTWELVKWITNENEIILQCKLKTRVIHNVLSFTF